MLEHVDACTAMKDSYRLAGFSVPTYYSWKSNYSSIRASILRQMSQRDVTFSKLTFMHAELPLENHATKYLIAKQP